MKPSSGRSVRHLVVTSIATLALVLGAAACGSADSEFSEVGQRGRETANSSGCASCHGANGQGGVGPGWIDLAGSERELTDGSVVVADDAYLRRSILEPQAEEVVGFALKMPTNGLSEAEAADIVQYIKELTSDDA